MNGDGASPDVGTSVEGLDTASQGLLAVGERGGSTSAAVGDRNKPAPNLALRLEAFRACSRSRANSSSKYDPSCAIRLSLSVRK